MSTVRSLFIGTCLLSVSALAWAQATRVDPAWLRSFELAWDAKPEALSSKASITAPGEPGQAMVVNGRVLSPDGAAAAGVIVQAYHRDRAGLEFGTKDRATRTWRLQGWARTNAEGAFQFHTIRPAADALGREAAHVHFTLISASFGRQWAPKVFLADDPLVTEAQRRDADRAGAFSTVVQVREEEGVEYLDVVLPLKAQGDF